MTTYKMHTCLRRHRFSYLVVLCAPSDWKSGHLYATPAGGSIRGRAGGKIQFLLLMIFDMRRIQC